MSDAAPTPADTEAAKAANAEEAARVKAEVKAARDAEAAQKKAEKEAQKEAKRLEREAAVEAKKVEREAKIAEAEAEKQRKAVAAGEAKAAEAEKNRIAQMSRARLEQELADARALAKAKADELRQVSGSASPSSVVDQSRYHYSANGVKTGTGRASVDCGDEVAVALRGLSTDQIVEAVAANGGEVNPAWANLNNGLRRMSASNVLRRIAKTKALDLPAPEVAAA